MKTNIQRLIETEAERKLEASANQFMTFILGVLLTLIAVGLWNY